MHRKTACSLAFACLVVASSAACQATGDLAAVGPRATRPPGATEPAAGRPTPAPTATPKAGPTSAAPTPTPTPAAATPAPAARLQRPAGASAVMAGAVRLDAGYMVGVGAGQVLSPNGSPIVAAGGLNLIGNAGNTLVAAGAGNVISHNGGLVISHNGGQVLSHNGSQVISHNGGQAIARRRLLQAAAAPAPGTMLPAAGVEVRVYDLRTGAAVALGQGPDGAPVYGVLTDAAGRYELYVPAALAHNLLVRAQVPGQADPRLAIDLVAPPPKAAQAGYGEVVDEDTAVAALYLRKAFAAKLEAVLAAGSLDDGEFLKRLLAGADAPGFEALARQSLGEFRDRVAKAGVPAARHPELAARCADALLAHVDLADVRIDNRFPAYAGSDDERAVPGLVAVLAGLRGRAAAKLAAEGPTAFDSQPWMVAANATRKAGLPAFQVLKAADLGDVLVDAFVTSIDPAQLQQVVAAIYAVGGSEADGAHLFAAASGIGARLGTAFLADEAARADVFAAIDALGR